MRWLYNELPTWESQGLVSVATAQKLRAYYGEPPRISPFTVFGILGTLLVGLGIILLLAHNWEDLTRPVRTVLSLAPLVAAQGLALWIHQKRSGSSAWRESGAVALICAIGASIALIGQTYHLDSRPADFLLTWILLSFPLPYLLRSSAAAVLYIVGITTWIGFTDLYRAAGMGYWLLALLIGPYLWRTCRADPDSPRANLLGLVSGVSLGIAVGLIMEHRYSGSWMVVYSSLFAVYYLINQSPFREKLRLPLHPFGIIGLGGLAVLTMLFTYEWPWQHLLHPWRLEYTTWNARTIHDVLLMILLPAASVGLLIPGWMRRRNQAWEWGLLPVAVILGIVGTMRTDTPTAASLLMNSYCFALGAATLARGFQFRRLGLVNGGFVFLAVWIGCRFFDYDLSFVVRGVAFIMIGLAFLVINGLLARRYRQGGAR